MRKMDNATIDGGRISVEFAREIPSRIGGQTDFRYFVHVSPQHFGRKLILIQDCRRELGTVHFMAGCFWFVFVESMSGFR